MEASPQSNDAAQSNLAKRLLKLGGFLFSALILYLLFWPVVINPIAWQAPPNPKYTGPFKSNTRLAKLELISVGEHHGPEDLAVDKDGLVYIPSHDGHILRWNPQNKSCETWISTGGRPLGIEFDGAGQLIVADAYLGLLSISPSKVIVELVTEVDGKPLKYADDLDVAKDGKIYFSDASSQFGAKESGGTLEASYLDILEHRGHGRLLVYDPNTKKTAVLLSGIQFANGVAVSPEQDFVLVNETGSYRVLKYWLLGPKKGQSEVLIENLPAFPDNLSAGQDGRFWIGFIAPRNDLIDRCAPHPFLRSVIARLPKFLKPKPVHYSHVIAIDKNGVVLQDLQDPTGRLPKTTGVYEGNDFLYLSSLDGAAFGRLNKSDAGL
ncbi:MAG: SMP-30/gluconolactonase/LRE family protein [Planctomycetota bacterium]|nr:SMP-30/gluconolactonase/LRE family protein [Planctomycetota bacterium]